MENFSMHSSSACAATSYMPLISALFRDLDQAEQAYRSASECGYGFHDINVVMSEATRRRYYSGHPRICQPGAPGGSKNAENTTLGAIEYALAAVGAPLVLAKFRLVVAGNYSALSAGGDGTHGSLADTLFRWRIPVQHIKDYERGIRAGGIIISIRPRNGEDAAHITHSWQAYHGECVLA